MDRKQYLCRMSVHIIIIIGINYLACELYRKRARIIIIIISFSNVQETEGLEFNVHNYKHGVMFCISTELSTCAIQLLNVYHI